MKKLYLSQKDKKMGGVLGGIAESLEIDSTLIRVLFIALLFITGVVPMIIAYLLWWMIIPQVPQSHA